MVLMIVLSIIGALSGRIATDTAFYFASLT